MTGLDFSGFVATEMAESLTDLRPQELTQPGDIAGIIDLGNRPQTKPAIAFAPIRSFHLHRLHELKCRR